MVTVECTFPVAAFPIEPILTLERKLFGGAQQSWSVAPDKFTVIASNTRARAREGLDDGASTYSNGNTTMFNTSDSNVNRVFFSGTYIAA